MPDIFDFGKNSSFILICYGVSIAILGTMILMTIRRRIRAARNLAKIENKSRNLG